MSMWEWQCRELRRLADKLGNEEEVSAPFVRVLVIPIMREAADTIAALSRRLQEQAKRGNEDKRESCESNYDKLFGTPERAARTLVERLDVDVINWCNGDCENCPYEYNRYGCEQDLTLLEWLESEVRDD